MTGHTLRNINMAWVAVSLGILAAFAAWALWNDLRDARALRQLRSPVASVRLTQLRRLVARRDMRPVAAARRLKLALFDLAGRQADLRRSAAFADAWKGAVGKVTTATHGKWMRALEEAASDEEPAIRVVASPILTEIRAAMVEPLLDSLRGCQGESHTVIENALAALGPVVTEVMLSLLTADSLAVRASARRVLERVDPERLRAEETRLAAMAEAAGPKLVANPQATPAPAAVGDGYEDLVAALRSFVAKLDGWKDRDGIGTLREYRAAAKEIGIQLDRRGGKQMMLAAFRDAGAGRSIEAAWEGIGEWRG